MIDVWASGTGPLGVWTICLCNQCPACRQAIAEAAASSPTTPAA